MHKRINLFVDAHVFDGIPQGTVTYLSGLYSELIKDTRFRLYVGSNDKSLVEKYLKSNDFIHIPYNTHSKFKRLIKVIPKALEENNIDFAHFQYISPVVKKCKYIVTIHDLLFLEFPKNFPLIYRIKNSILFYLSSKRADIVTTVSEYSKESIIRFFNIPQSKIEVTPNAVSLKEISVEPIKILIDKKFILFVSRIEPRKNQALLIKLWKELKFANQDINLVLVGSVGLKDNNFESELNNLSVEEQKKFYFLSRVPDGQLKWLYQNCILFVFPSVAEGFGIPPLEAAMNGAKVLCSNTTSMKEFEFFDRFHFNPNNTHEFKDAIKFALQNEFESKVIKDKIKSKYNWEKIAADFGKMIMLNVD